MEAQAFFDFTVNAVRAQRVPSMNCDTMTCFYRGPNGLKCAAGHSITDEEYLPEMESRLVYQLNLPRTHVLVRHEDLAASLQKAHDESARASGEEEAVFLSRFEQMVERIAEAYDLKYTAPGVVA